MLVGLGLSLLQRFEDFRHKTVYDQTLRLPDHPDNNPPARESIIASRHIRCMRFPGKAKLLFSGHSGKKTRARRARLPKGAGNPTRTALLAPCKQSASLNALSLQQYMVSRFPWKAKLLFSGHSGYKPRAKPAGLPKGAGNPNRIALLAPCMQ